MAGGSTSTQANPNAQTRIASSAHPPLCQCRIKGNPFWGCLRGILVGACDANVCRREATGLCAIRLPASVNPLIHRGGTSIAPAFRLMLQLAEVPALVQAAWAKRQSRRVRGERELLTVIGNPLLAARPSSPTAL